MGKWYALWLLSVVALAECSPYLVAVDTVLTREESSKPCQQKQVEHGIVCVCSEDYCDTVAPLDLDNVAQDTAVMYRSTSAGERLERSEVKLSSGKSDGEAREIVVDPSQTLQTMIGFGGAFTDAFGVNIRSVPDGVGQSIMESYFGPDGLQYSVGRVPMGSCDFSTESYFYAEENDLNMENFTLHEHWDKQLRIPLIKEAMRLVESNGDRQLRLFTSPWSSPPWMKENDSIKVGKLKGFAGGMYYQAWAKYMNTYLSKYEEEGVKFWGMTIQNEPNAAPGAVRWEAISMPAEDQRDFIKKNIGPMLREQHPDVALMMFDDQKTNLEQYAQTVLSDEDAAKFVDGVAIHWYSFPTVGHQHMAKVYDKYLKNDNKFILGSEACAGYLPFINGVRLGDWDRAEKYASDIIDDIIGMVSGWTDWNLALDMQGGPNHAKNFVDAPVIVDAENKVAYKQPTFYALGHFSKFVSAGSTRIASETTGITSKTLQHVAFIAESGEVIVVIQNTSKQAQDVAVAIRTVGDVNITLPPNSIQTLVVPHQ